MLSFAPFEPDKASFNPSASEQSVNALPVADGWGPMPELIVTDDALPTTCVGAAWVRDSDGGFFIIAATATKLWRYVGAVWTDITGSTALNVPVGDSVQFFRFGNRVIACALGAVPQWMDVDSGTVFADLAGAPEARFGCVSGDFVIFGSLLNEPNMLKWSGINDPEYWTVGERGCDFQILPDGDEITGLFGAPLGAYIFQRSCMRTMAFNPASGYTFTITVEHPTRGTPAPYSIVPVGPGDFIFLSIDGFYRGFGTQLTPIGVERVDGWFFEEADLTDFVTVRGVADPFSKIVWFDFQASAGINALLGYKWTLDRWCTITDGGVHELAAIVMPAITIDSFPVIIDAVNIPIDSKYFKGGFPIFAGFTFENKLAVFDGVPRAATLATADVELVPGSRAFVNAARVYTDTIDLTVTVGKRDYLGGTQTLTTPSAPSTVTGVAPLRASAKFHRFIVDIEAGAEWKNCVGIEPVFIEEGKR